MKDCGQILYWVILFVYTNTQYIYLICISFIYFLQKARHFCGPIHPIPILTCYFWVWTPLLITTITREHQSQQNEKGLMLAGYSKMVDKVFFKIAANVAVNIVLLIIYAHYFGRQSIQKFLEKDVTIVKNKETPTNIPPPGKISSEFYILYNII